MLPNETLISLALGAFLFDWPIVSVTPYGNGHINATYLVEAKKRYILQRLNPEVFPYSKETCANLIAVTLYLRSAINEAKKAGFMTEQKPLALVQSKEGTYCYHDPTGAYWRSYLLLEGSETREEPLDEEDLYASGKAFGSFLYFLRDYPSEKLFTTIPHFHDTPRRYLSFLEAVKDDKLSRKKTAETEIGYLEDHASFYSWLENGLASGEIPYRVCHNDTKFNNLLFKKNSHEVLTVLDLDTVMRGSPLYDFGDGCRSSCNTVRENEKEVSKVHFDLARFERYSKGYLVGSHLTLTREEEHFLPDSVLLLTLELALRFLEDYLRGDSYFGVSYPEENLVRARNQIALAQDIETKLPEMRRILKKAKDG
jgi:aminoglycoside phosphotransferase (APT) family kinase protein